MGEGGHGRRTSRETVFKRVQTTTLVAGDPAGGGGEGGKVKAGVYIFMTPGFLDPCGQRTSTGSAKTKGRQQREQTQTERERERLFNQTGSNEIKRLKRGTANICRGIIRPLKGRTKKGGDPDNERAGLTRVTKERSTGKNVRKPKL